MFSNQAADKQPDHSADLAVFYVTTILCAVCALMLPLAG